MPPREFTLLRTRGGSLAQPGDSLAGPRWPGAAGLRRLPGGAARRTSGCQAVTSLREADREEREAGGGAGLAAGRAVPRVGSADRPVQRRGESSLRTRARLFPGSGGKAGAEAQRDPALQTQGRAKPHVPCRGLSAGSPPPPPSPGTVSPTRKRRALNFFFFFFLPGRLQGGGKGRWRGLPRLRGEDCVPLLIKRSPRKMVSDMR